MAWKISKAKRQALVKLQLRDKKGRWIEMGGGVKWYSSRLKRQVSGTVVGTKGENALVRLDKQEGQDRSPLVSVAARNITVIDDKASLAPTTMGTPTDKTAEFEGAIPVANEANGARKGNGFQKPSDSPEDYQVTATSDGRAYIGRNDGAEIYFPARSLEVGDVLMAPEGGDETKPFSIGKGWAKKGVESVNTSGPKTGTVLRIEGDRYAVVQLPDGFTVPDKKHEGEQTDLVTVGLSNSVIKLTDGMQKALGDHINATFDGNGEDEEIDDAEEANSDHEGREVPEEEVAAEENPADVDLSDLTDGEEEEKAAPIEERAREIDVPQADNSGSDDQSLNENGLTDDEQKMVKAYDRMAQRAYDQGNVENGATYEANANRLRKLGEDRRAGAKADPDNTEDKPAKDVEEADRQRKAEELFNEPEAVKSEDEKRYDATQAEVRKVRNPGEDENGESIEGDLSDPRIKAAEDADQNAQDSVDQGQVKPETPEWFDIWNSTYASSLEDQQEEERQRKRQEEEDAETARLEAEDAAQQAPNLEEPDTLESVKAEIRKVTSEHEAIRRRGESVPPEKLQSVLDLFDKRDALEKSEQDSAPEPEKTPEDLAKMQPSASGLYTRGFQWLSKATLDRLPDGTMLRAPAKGGSKHANGFTPEDSAKKENGKWYVPSHTKDQGLVWEEVPEDQQQNALKNMNVWSTPKQNDAAFEDFDGNLNGLNTGDRIKLVDGQTGVFAPRKNGAAAFYGDKTGKQHSILDKNPVFKVAKYDDRADERFLNGYDIRKDSGLGKVRKNYYEDDYSVTSTSADLIAALPIGSSIATTDQDRGDAGFEIVKVAPDVWAHPKRWADRGWTILSDSDMVEYDVEQGIKLPGNPKLEPLSQRELDSIEISRKEHVEDSARVRQGLEEAAREIRGEQSAPKPENSPEPAEEPVEAPEDAPEGFTPTGDQPYPNLGMDEPTLFKQTVRGKARTELEFADETARESEYDQGYRMNQGRIEVYDFDRALSSLEDNISPWYQYADAIPTRENPNAGGYTAGHTKAQINAVINGIEKLQEAIRTAKAEHDSRQESGSEEQDTAPAVNSPEATPEAPEETNATPEEARKMPSKEEVLAVSPNTIEQITAGARGDYDSSLPTSHPGLTRLEQEAVNKYMFHGQPINEASSGKQELTPEVAGRIAALDQTIAESRVKAPMTVFRAFGSDPERLKKSIADGVFTGSSYNSSSMDQNYADEWGSIRSAGDKDFVMLEINTPEGFTAHALDYPDEHKGLFGQEQEVLFPRGTSFKIESTEEYTNSSGKVGIKAKVTPILTDENHFAGETEAEAPEVASEPLDRPIETGMLAYGSAHRLDEAIAENPDSGVESLGDRRFAITDLAKGEDTLNRARDAVQKAMDEYAADKKWGNDQSVLAKYQDSLDDFDDLLGMVEDRRAHENRVAKDQAPSQEPKAPEASPELDENGLTPEEARQLEIAREEDYLGGIADKDPESRPYYQKPIDDLLERGQKRLNGEDPDAPQGDYQAEDGHAVYTEGGEGRVPDLKATAQAVKEAGVESVRVPISDAPKKDYTPEELEHSFDRREKTGLTDSVFDALPKEYQRFKDQDAPADPINLPEDEENTAEASDPTGRFDNMNPTQEEQAQLDEFDRAMDEAVASDDVDAYDKASDAKYDLMEEIAARPAEDSASESEESGSEAGEPSEESGDSTQEASDPEVHPLDALGIQRRTPEAVEGESYAPTQQQQDVIDAVLGGLDTKVQAMAGTGKTSTLVALSRRIGEQGGQAIYIAYNKTVQQEADKRMKGLPVEAKTGHGVAYQWALKNMPFLNARVDGRDPMKPVAFYKNGKPKEYARKYSKTSAGEISSILGIKEGDVKEESGIPLRKSAIVLAIKKTVESYALSDSDTILPEHVPDTFEIAEAHLPKIVDYANEYWADLSREDGDFRVTHDVYRKHWALSRPDLTDGSGGNDAGANILYIDEAQDTPPVLAKVVADQKMQKVIVGDANQAIYAFAQNIDYLSEADGDIELPLNKSWRFGPEVADAGNRFLEMLGSESRVIGGGGPGKVVYGMEDADAVLVRTNAGMIHAIVEETDRDRRVTAPKGTRSQLESMVETVEALMEGYAPETPHDDLIGFKDWDQVKGAYAAGDKGLGKIVKLFDVVGREARDLKQEEIDAIKATKMARAKKAIDHLVIDVPGFNEVRLVQKGDRTYLEAAEENPYPIEEDGTQKPWGGNAKKYAVANFSANLGKTRKPWLSERGLKFIDQQNKYRDEGGLVTVGWKQDRNWNYYTEDPEVIKKFQTFSGVSDVTVSTAHKSKGLEWDRVRVGDDFIGPYEDFKTGAMVWPEDDEYKLGYVALTRAAKEIDPGSLSYVFDYTQPNGGDPKAKKETESPVEVPEDTTPEPEQVADEAPTPSEPDNSDDLDEAVAETKAEEVAPEPAPVVESTPEPELEVALEPEVAPEPEAPEPTAEDLDEITGLTPEEEARKDQLLKDSRQASRDGDIFKANKLNREAQNMFDMGHKRLKALRDAKKQETPAPEPTPVPEVVAPAPDPVAPSAPFDEDGLTPEEAARAGNLSKWINDVYKGYGQGNVKKMENELDDLWRRGEKRLAGESDAEEPIDVTPEFETPEPVADPPGETEVPSPVDEVPVAPPAAEAPKRKKSAPTGRKRGQSTVPDANGDQIRVGDTIKHKKHGDVIVTGVLPGAGRVTFTDPKTGKESSVKGDAISLNKAEPATEAPMGIVTGNPGDRLIDPNSGKKAFIGSEGLMIVTGQRVRDIKTGQIGTVQTVYTGADKKASVPILFDGEKEPRRVRGTQLSHASEGGSEAPETEPLIPATPEPAPAPEKPSSAPKAPEPAPEPEKAPEPAPAPTVVDDEKTARRRAAIGNAPADAEVHSKDGSEIYTKITADVWENYEQTESFTDDEILDKILNGEADGKGYIIRTPRPAPVPEPEPAPQPEPEPEPEVEIGPAAPDTSLSGQALADTITYESTLHMTDGDLADMLARYADDPVVFDKIMEVMDERDANAFLPVETDRSGATLDDQPALFDIPEPVAKEAAKREKKLTPQQKAAEEYQNYVMSQYTKALNDLNGVLLNDAGKAYARGAGGSDLEINLFSGSASIARKYASEELLQWWLENGRETLGSFRYRMYGWENDRKAAQTVRSLGYERGQVARGRSNL